MKLCFLLTLNLLHGLLSTEVQDPDNSHSRLSTTTISLEEEGGKPSLKRQNSTEESLKRQNTTEEVIKPKKHEPWIVPVAAFGVVGCLVGFAMAGWLLEEFFFYEKGIGQTILFAIVLLFIVVGGYVGHAEVIKLEPRVAGNHSVLMAILDMGSFGLLFPFGLYMYGTHKVKQILLPTLFLAVVQLASYICWVHSFQYLSVASYSIIVQISPVVIYPMEILLLKKRFLISKLLLVMLGVGGLLLIFVSHKTKSDGKEEMLYGYVLCTVGVLLLCVYQISYSMLIPALPATASSGENIRFQTFFLGLRGALIAIIAVPLYALFFVMNDTYRKKFNDGFPNESEVTVMFGAVMINWCWNYGAQIALVIFFFHAKLRILLYFSRGKYFSISKMCR